MTGVTRILVLLGLLVLGVALFMLGRDERPAALSVEPRIGRSTLSHGGPGAGSIPVAPAEAPSADRRLPSNQSPYATTR
ncbi:MAG: hypothetical protein AABZ34_01050 [Nitrospirota bacterium]